MHQVLVIDLKFLVSLSSNKWWFVICLHIKRDYFIAFPFKYRRNISIIANEWVHNDVFKVFIQNLIFDCLFL